MTTIIPTTTDICNVHHHTSVVGELGTVQETAAKRQVPHALEKMIPSSKKMIFYFLIHPHRTLQHPA